jgi:cardiolipin synthase A/B
MRRRSPIPQFLVAGALLAGCATPPAVDRDIARAMDDARALPSGIDGMRIEGEKLARAPFLTGNSVTLLKNGTPTYDAMREAISAAKTRIDMESYEIDETEGGKFADLLLSKRAEGVEVALIYDAWGSMDTSGALFDRLRQGGVHVVEYHPLVPTPSLPFDVNQRDHRKLLVLDGTIAITGGVNVSDVYEIHHRAHSDQADPDKVSWRDTDVRIEGPVVGQFEAMFLKTWQEEKGDPLTPPPPPPVTTQGPHDGALVQAIDGAPDDDHPLIYRTLMVAIALARSSVHLTTGFFVPPPDMEDALEAAAERGVDVEIVVPALTDSDESLAAGRAKYADLLAAGVQIYERQGATLHAKTAVIDGAWSAIGSSNLDWRSVVFNKEIDAVIIDPGFGGVMEAMFAEDRTRSARIDAAAWDRRPLSERLREWKATLLERLL